MDAGPVGGGLQTHPQTSGIPAIGKDVLAFSQQEGEEVCEAGASVAQGAGQPGADAAAAGGAGPSEGAAGGGAERAEGGRRVRRRKQTASSQAAEHAPPTRAHSSAAAAAGGGGGAAAKLPSKAAASVANAVIEEEAFEALAATHGSPREFAAEAFAARAVELRSVSTSLSYPLTAAWALARYNVVQAAVRRADVGRRPLVVCVCGASGAAELAGGLDKWQVRQGQQGISWHKVAQHPCLAYPV